LKTVLTAAFATPVVLLDLASEKAGQSGGLLLAELLALLLLVCTFT